MNAPTLVYPRSTATSPVTISGGTNVTIDADTGAISFAAPEKGTTYTAEKPLAVPTIGGLVDGETATFEAGAILTSTEPAVTFSIDATGNVTSDVPVPGDFAGAAASVQINVDGVNGAYNKTVEVAIPAAVLPAHQLDPAEGALLDREGGWTVTDAMAEFLKGANAGWVLLTDENKPTDCTYTPVAGTDDLTPDGGAAGDGVYSIPLYRAAVDGAYRETAALFQLTISAAPTQDGVNGLVADSAYTSTIDTITFTNATNTAWEYAVVKESDADTTDLTTLTYQTGAEVGATFEGLASGTNYLLAVRAAAKPDSYEASTPVKSTTAAVTKYDLALTSAYLETDTEQSTTIKESADVPTVFAVTAGPITDTSEAGKYVQVITLTNTNGNTIYNVEANVYNPGGETPNADFDAAIDGEAAAVAANGTITVKVTPQVNIAKGEHTADLVITAYDAAIGGNQVVKKTIRIELTVYGNRDGEATGTAPITLRPAGLSNPADGDVLAGANTAIKLNVTWDGKAADSYALVTEARAVDGALVQVMTGSEATAAGITTDSTNAGIEENGWYLVTTADVNTLGKLATVQATFAQDDTEHYIEESTTFDVFVKAKATDEIVDGDGNPIVVPAIQKIYDVVLPAETDVELDLTGGIVNATVSETGALAGATLDTTTGKLTIAHGSTDYGAGRYTVTIPANDAYDEGTIEVTVNVLKKRTISELDDIDLVVGAEGTDGKKVYLPGSLTVDGAEYAGAVTYTVFSGKEALASGDVKQDETGYYVQLPDSVTDAAKIEVTVSIDKNTTTFEAAADTIQTIYLRKAAELTGTTLYEYTAGSTPAEAVVLDVTGGADGTDGAITYAVKSGGGVVTLNAEGSGFTVSGDQFGKAVITATSAQTDTWTEGTLDIEVYVRKAADPDGGSGDIETGDPYNGTGASILGAAQATSSDYDKAFDVDTDGDGVKDHWSAGMVGVKYANLTPGVKYQIRYKLEDAESWFVGTPGTTVPPSAGTVDADGWWTLNILAGESGATADSFTLVPSSGNLIAAQIRYLPGDGTVGDTTEVGPQADVPETGKYTSVIHGLNPQVNYQYRVKTAENTFELVDGVTNADGWRDLPMEEAETDTLDSTKMQYTVTRDFEFAGVETRYASDPSISKDTPAEGDYTITGLIPNANYDLAPGTAESFVEEPVNYITIRADENGTIVIKKGSEQKTFLGDDPYHIRLSKTDDTEAGEDVVITSGVSITGKVTSYNPKQVITIELYNGDTLKYSMTIGAQDQSGVVTQQFKLEGVAAGTYKLVIRKNYHLTFTKQVLTVGTEDMVLYESAGEGKEPVLPTVILVPGDINQDGYVNGNDLTVLLDPSNFLASSWTDEGANINGDGYVNGNDLTVLLDPANFLQNNDGQTID